MKVILHKEAVEAIREILSVYPLPIIDSIEISDFEVVPLLRVRQTRTVIRKPIEIDSVEVED